MRDIFSITTSRHSSKLGGEIILEKMIHDTSLNNRATSGIAVDKDADCPRANHDAHHRRSQRQAGQASVF